MIFIPKILELINEFSHKFFGFESIQNWKLFNTKGTKKKEKKKNLLSLGGRESKSQKILKGKKVKKRRKV